MQAMIAENELTRIETTGLVSPMFLDHPAVRQVLAAMERRAAAGGGARGPCLLHGWPGSNWGKEPERCSMPHCSENIR